MKKVVILNPTNYLIDSFLVLHGGSWYYFAWLCRSVYRDRDEPSNRFSYVGFRVVKGIKDEKDSYIKSK